MTAPQAAAEPSGRRDRHRQATRTRILDAALALFLEQGYAATSVDEIAERADVARRTLFNHFVRKLVWPALLCPRSNVMSQRPGVGGADPAHAVYRYRFSWRDS